MKHPWFMHMHAGVNSHMGVYAVDGGVFVRSWGEGMTSVSFYPAAPARREVLELGTFNDQGIIARSTLVKNPAAEADLVVDAYLVVLGLEKIDPLAAKVKEAVVRFYGDVTLDCPERTRLRLQALSEYIADISFEGERISARAKHIEELLTALLRDVSAGSWAQRVHRINVFAMRLVRNSRCEIIVPEAALQE